MFLSLIFFKQYTTIIYYIYSLYYYIKLLFNNKSIKIFKYKEKRVFFYNYLNIFKFFFNAYYFNEIYNSFVYKYKNIGYILFKNLDKGLIE
jgi:hypothetical protein